METSGMIDLKQLYVAQRNYPMSVLAADEGYTRKAAEHINIEIAKLQKKEPARDYQDCLAVILIGAMRRLLKYDEPLESLDR